MGSGYAAELSPADAWLVLASGAVSEQKRAVNRTRAGGEATDAELLSRAAGGDRGAFDAIVARHGPFALRVAARLVADAASAEDVVQEAMLRAWSQAGKFDPSRARFTTWLYRIVVNLCIDQRRRRPLVPLPESYDAVDPALRADQVLEIDERRLALAGALSGLPTRQRAAVALVYEEGLSGVEAAQILGLSAKAVERLLARARAQLRARLLPERIGGEL